MMPSQTKQNRSRNRHDQKLSTLFSFEWSQDDRLQEAAAEGAAIATNETRSRQDLAAAFSSNNKELTTTRARLSDWRPLVAAKPPAGQQQQRRTSRLATVSFVILWLTMQDLLSWTTMSEQAPFVPVGLHGRASWRRGGLASSASLNYGLLWTADDNCCQLATRGEFKEAPTHHWSFLGLAEAILLPVSHNGHHMQPSSRMMSRRQVSSWTPTDEVEANSTSLTSSSSSDNHQPLDNESSTATEEEPGEEQYSPEGEQGVDQQQSLCNQYIRIKNRLPPVLIRLLFFCLYGLIFAIGLIGNTLTLYAMRRKREKSSIIDIFIANLALSDIMLCIFAVPITPIYMLYHGHWVFGAGLCKAFAFAQGASVYISTFTMISIAHLRYQLIVHPLQESMSKLAALLLNLCTWIIGFMVTWPYLMHVGLLPENCVIKFCDEYWDQDLGRFWFSVITLILQFFLPFIAVSFFYGSIFWKLRQQRLRRQRKLDSVLQRTQEHHTHHFYHHLYRHQHHSHQPHFSHHRHHQNNHHFQLLSASTGGQLAEPSTCLQEVSSSQANPAAAKRELLSAIEMGSPDAAAPPPMLLVRVRTGSHPDDRLLRTEPLSGTNGNGGEAGPLGSFAISSAGIMASITLPRLAPCCPPKLDEEATMRRRMTLAEADRPGPLEQRSPSGSLKRTLSQRAHKPPKLPALQRQQQQLAVDSRPAAGQPLGATLQLLGRRSRAPEEPPAADILALKEQRLREKDKRLSQTNRKLLFMVVLFVLSWLPLNMFNLVQDYSETISDSPYIKHVFLIVHLVACSSVCYNPILYAWMSDNYRQELRDILPKQLAKRCCCLLTGELPSTATT